MSQLLNINYNHTLKTTGPRMAQFLMEVYGSGRATFTSAKSSHCLEVQCVEGCGF